MLELGFSLADILVRICSDLSTLFNRDFILALWNMKNEVLH